MNKIFPTTLVVLLICIAVISQLNSRRKGKHLYKQFYNNEINGKIEDISASTGTTYFVIDGIKYGFYPKDFSKNKHRIFYRFAKIGDSICKPAKHDTLKLINQDKIYQFTFKKLK